jgi:hypothetical protein
MIYGLDSLPSPLLAILANSAFEVTTIGGDANTLIGMILALLLPTTAPAGVILSTASTNPRPKSIKRPRRT